MIELHKHSPCGPSSLARRFGCPGSYRMEKDLHDTESEHSKLGTSLHAIVSRALLGDESGLKDLDSDEEGAAAFCIGFAERLIKDNPQHTLLVEFKADLNHIHELVGFGTGDFALVLPFDSAIMLDWKFLFQEVEPAWKNKQLMAYASSLVEKYQLHTVTCYTVQPHQSKVTKHTFTAEELRAQDEKTKTAIVKCLEPDAPLSAGSHCKFCKAKVGCPELAGKAKSLPIKKDASVLSVSDMAEYLNMADSVLAWIGAIKQRAFAILSEGGEIPGWTLEPGRGSRQWTEAAERALGAIAVQFGKDSSSVYTQPELLSPAQMEKLLGKSKKVQEALAPLIVKLPGKLALRKDGEND